MATQHNMFIRKFGKYAVVMTITDWEDFKELEQHAEEGHEDPDFLLGAITDANIYTNMNPSMLVSVRGEVKDITEQTKGMGLSAILTGTCGFDPIWSYRKIDGLFATSHMLKPKISEG